jgi:hypothetical protein
MPIDPVNPLGWGPKDPITSAQMNGLDQRLVRAVDGVQGGTYAAPISLSHTKLIDSSSVDTNGSITTTAAVQAEAFVMPVATSANLADGANVDCNGFVASRYHLATAGAGGIVRITLTWALVRTGALYVVTLDHSNVLLGHVELTWSGVGMKHRFSGGVALDGQPTPTLSRDMWTGVAVSGTEIYWTLTRGLI